MGRDDAASSRPIARRVTVRGRDRSDTATLIPLGYEVNGLTRLHKLEHCSQRRAEKGSND